MHYQDRISEIIASAGPVAMERLARLALTKAAKDLVSRESHRTPDESLVDLIESRWHRVMEGEDRVKRIDQLQFHSGGQ